MYRYHAKHVSVEKLPETPASLEVIASLARIEPKGLVQHSAALSYGASNKKNQLSLNQTLSYNRVCPTPAVIRIAKHNPGASIALLPKCKLFGIPMSFEVYVPHLRGIGLLVYPQLGKFVSKLPVARTFYLPYKNSI